VSREEEVRREIEHQIKRMPSFLEAAVHGPHVANPEQVAQVASERIQFLKGLAISLAREIDDLRGESR
jgi:hypothetical protein